MLGGFFSSKEEAKSSNSQYKYSILTEINDEFRDKDHKFTFALIYPEIKLYNIWQQSNNPLSENKKWTTNNYYYVEGYQNITILAKRNEDYCRWGGLLLSHSESLIDGCPGGQEWFYTIGYVGRGWGPTEQNFLIPSNNDGVNIVSLWVKVIDDKYKIILSCQVNNYISFVYWISYLVFVMTSE